MAVSTRDSELKLMASIVEVRYEDGFSFYDRQGEIILRVRKIVQNVLVGPVPAKVISFKDLDQKIDFNVTAEKFDVGTTSPSKLHSGEQVAGKMAKLAHDIYAPITDAIGVQNTIRVGARFHYFAPADSIESADKFICKAFQSQMTKALAKIAGGQMIDGVFVMMTDEPETGHRRQMQVYSAILKEKESASNYTGLGVPEGTGGILVDIDSYTRPPSGHYEALQYFVNQAFGASKRIATETLGWMADQQKVYHE